ncbi:hypothetical protein CK203_063336 [Vitis vinifera]|uniref:Uncharacterized protein n=1 Tax=Vitis vinifera TaxID=29760 RepID=A0A438FPB1_VITVI|nr:hypothetical protein CK203_063336 [Vitis vinifera]
MVVHFQIDVSASDLSIVRCLAFLQRMLQIRADRVSELYNLQNWTQMHFLQNTQLLILDLSLRPNNILSQFLPHKLMWVVPRECFICITEGFSGPDLVRIVVGSPSILKRSLENHLIPSYNFLKSMDMVHENIVKAFSRSYWLTGKSVQDTIASNVEILKEIGVPMSNISSLVAMHPCAVFQNREKFSRSVEKVFEMGINPLRVTFLKAVQVICGVAESMWEHKMQVYRHIARYPTVFLRSLEKKIIPRCSVVKVLQMKGLVKKDLCLGILGCSEENFFDKFVVKYEQDVPELLNVYQGKIGILELGFVSEGLDYYRRGEHRRIRSTTKPDFLQTMASVHPMPPVQFLQTWKLLQDLESSLTDLPMQNACLCKKRDESGFCLLGEKVSWRNIFGHAVVHFQIYLSSSDLSIVFCANAFLQLMLQIGADRVSELYDLQNCALSASRKVQFETPERADSVLALLRNYGCTNTHISKIVSRYPLLLTANPEKTLLPKLEFFRSVGFSGPDLASIVVSSPIILRRSLENHVIPSYNFLKSVVMVNENIVRAFKKTFWISGQNVQNAIAPNIAILEEIGVPMSNMKFLVTCHPNVVSQNREKFSRSVKKVIEMGFNPLRLSFLKAIEVSCQLTESMLEHKMEVYRRWGLTDDEIMSMFRLDPLCMKSSEKKIMSVMDFLVNKMGWEPAAFARYPTVFLCSLEKKIIHGVQR